MIKCSVVLCIFDHCGVYYIGYNILPYSGPQTSALFVASESSTHPYHLQDGKSK